MSCHTSGAAGAPIIGNSQQWTERISEGKKYLYEQAINGVGVMPAKGGVPTLSDDEVKKLDCLNFPPSLGPKYYISAGGDEPSAWIDQSWIMANFLTKISLFDLRQFFLDLIIKFFIKITF